MQTTRTGGLKECGLIDIYLNLHDDLKNQRERECVDIKHLSWRLNRTSKGLRLDHLVGAPSSLSGETKMPGVVSCEYTASDYGSDHRPLVTTFNIQEHKHDHVETKQNEQKKNT